MDVSTLLENSSKDEGKLLWTPDLSQNKQVTQERPCYLFIKANFLNQRGPSAKQLNYIVKRIPNFKRIIENEEISCSAPS